MFCQVKSFPHNPLHDIVHGNCILMVSLTLLEQNLNMYILHLLYTMILSNISNMHGSNSLPLPSVPMLPNTYKCPCPVLFCPSIHCWAGTTLVSDVNQRCRTCRKYKTIHFDDVIVLPPSRGDDGILQNAILLFKANNR